MNEYKFPPAIRQVIIDALPQDTAVFGQTPDIRYTFTPKVHAKALHPDVMLVEGIRGAGKSFWWSVLQSAEHRRMMAHVLSAAGIDEKTNVSVGFGQNSNPNEYPGKDTLVDLSKKFEPRQIWRSVILKQLVKNLNISNEIPIDSWKNTIEWNKQNPETVERLLFSIDQKLNDDKIYYLILFDALDRTADDWPTMMIIIRGLLQVLLEFRSYKRIRPKAFLRPDNLKDPRVAEFPDASKVTNQRVELAWPRNELYGLLWHYLGNEPQNGNIFREGCNFFLNDKWQTYDNTIWTVPEQMHFEESVQRELFHAITGPYMGRDRRRGFPYSWLPNHLGDVTGQVSPRSFLAAIRHAANDTVRPDYQWTIYYESIKKGVQSASKIRVTEMLEDYPWVEHFMTPLKGITVPCQFSEIKSSWERNKVFDQIQNDTDKLPPSHISEGADGIRKDLDELGVFERMRDDRVNLPDVYRVGYGLGRKGGVKAIAR